MGTRISEVVEEWMPSPFLFAILLTFIVYVGGIVIEGRGPFEMIRFWNNGFWNLLTFAMQMVLILVTGFVLAYHPWVRRGIDWLAGLPNDGKQAVVLVGFVAMVVAWVHWGLGLIVGAILARETGRRARELGIDVHYPLLCVAGYMGLGLTWHWGLSASAPLLINTKGNVFMQQGVLEGLVPTSKTIFSTYALVLTGLSIIYACLMLYLLAPEPEETAGITTYVPESQLGDSDTVAADGGEETEGDAGKGPEPPEEPPGTGPTEPELDSMADRINHSKVIGGLIALMGIVFSVYTFATGGVNAISLNTVNFAFLFIGIALYTSPRAYQDEFEEAVSSSAGIILQFPFYAGIMGMMNQSGLAETVAETLVSISSPATFPIVAWITAGFVNIFVPSGGGEWTVIGPSIVNAAQELGVPVGKATIAYAVGDAHTNLFQPFWAIPLLGITGMRARDMFGYAVTMMLLLIPFLAVALVVVPY